jgi:hypothetical protein
MQTVSQSDKGHGEIGIQFQSLVQFLVGFHEIKLVYEILGFEVKLMGFLGGCGKFLIVPQSIYARYDHQ